MNKETLFHIVAAVCIGVGLLGVGFKVGRESNIPSPPPPPVCRGWKPPTGDICRRWHNATVIWQWEGWCKDSSGGQIECPVQQFPTVVCDKWETFKSQKVEEH